MKNFVSVGECMIELSNIEDRIFKMGFAGDTLNTAWYARALLSDAWSVSFATKLGNDELSQNAVSFLTENNIGTDLIDYHPSRKIGIYLINLKKGERSFSYWRDNSAARTLADNKSSLEKMLSKAEFIHFSGITLAIMSNTGRKLFFNILKDHKQRGVGISFDPNIRLAMWNDLTEVKKTISKAAELSTIVLPSFEDEKLCFKDRNPSETIRRYESLGAKIIVVKNSGEKIFALKDSKEIIFDNITIKNVVDSTGAGDSFNGGFLASILSGIDINEAIFKAHSLASKVICEKGALVPMDKISKMQISA